MPHQVAGIRECLSTSLADIRLLTRMCPHVDSQAFGLRERLSARLADMRRLPRMRAHVSTQAVGPRERLAAHVADMRPLPLVQRATTETLLIFVVRRVTTSGPPALVSTAHFQHESSDESTG